MDYDGEGTRGQITHRTGKPWRLPRRRFAPIGGERRWAFTNLQARGIRTCISSTCRGVASLSLLERVRGLITRRPCYSPDGKSGSPARLSRDRKRREILPHQPRRADREGRPGTRNTVNPTRRTFVPVPTGAGDRLHVEPHRVGRKYS